MLAFCHPQNLHNKRLNLILALVHWNFCLIRSKISAGTSLRIIGTGFQVHPVSLERIPAIPVCINSYIQYLKVFQTGHFLIASHLLFLKRLLFIFILLTKYYILRICYIKIYFQLQTTDICIGCEEVQSQL